jgi:hypothetical protein
MVDCEWDCAISAGRERSSDVVLATIVVLIDYVRLVRSNQPESFERSIVA